jgi:nicotinamide mononucleotide (NMN) deamidase PncC
MLFRQKLYDFVDQYKGPKLKIVAAGAGISLAELLTVPGASRIVSDIYLPYDTEELKKVIAHNAAWYAYLFNKDTFTAVSMSVADTLAEYGCTQNTLGVGITGALITDRYRKGDNHAYIAFKQFGKEIKSGHRQLYKFNESEHSKISIYDIRNA